MYNIIQFAQTHAHNYKTEKSIFNIITGKKSHQTFFDACSQQLLSLYHSMPNLKYQSFERYFNRFNDQHNSYQNIVNHPRHTFDSLTNTFKAIQLLAQTLSNTQHKVYQFVPITQHSTVHQQVKFVYKEIISNQLQEQFISELTTLFQSILNKNNTIYIHYYLQGFEESMYTRQQISLIEDIPQEHLFELEFTDLVTLMYEIEHESNYPLLNKLIVLPSLLNKTEQTYLGLQNGLNFEQLAAQQNVKPNTIDDHILELFIKGYISNYEDYLTHSTYTDFMTYYISHRSERLRNYKEIFSHLSYFELKLIIVGIERGEINVTT
ncbi:helix-turn-helix domain-containing protein [Staphylococcus equorum]|uniref:helix-turn-helix domain-containing protein n=1 Tax=Staphylococcus equorum TaxID=246432 RepID=UPI002981391B|nr:helix-turn-helix domain-containing protein [Staphylococcus equorum]MDW5471532.1 helix-turn-helix domain-containing protein [Staphylococcus equorum]